MHLDMVANLYEAGAQFDRKELVDYLRLQAHGLSVALGKPVWIPTVPR